MREFRFTATTAGWLIQAPGGLTATQITNARQTAATAGASIETVNNIPSLTQITDAATIFAHGARARHPGHEHRPGPQRDRQRPAHADRHRGERPGPPHLTAATAGALALTGAVTGTAGGYLAAIGFFSTNQLDQLSELDSVPVAEPAVDPGRHAADRGGRELAAGRARTAPPSPASHSNNRVDLTPL